MPSFKDRHLITIAELSRQEIEQILKKATEFKKKPPKNLLQDQIIASCFFEPSTRTRLSFETAALRLGAKVIGFDEGSNTSVKKGETLFDTIKVIGGYADLLVIRHPLEGSARLATLATNKPVINAGDGANQHPTQTLLDLFTIQECQKSLEGLKIAIVGDLKYGRTAHSLSYACALFDMRLFFVSPEELSLPESLLHELKKKRGKFSFHRSLSEIIDKVDILYVTRLQKERFDPLLYAQVKENYHVNLELLKKGKKNLKVLHPLPRVGEIEKEVDGSGYDYYFEQAENGVYVRQALLALLLGKTK